MWELQIAGRLGRMNRNKKFKQAVQINEVIK